MKIFAIIVTFNGEQYIERCINSIRTSNTHIEIIIVDNASTDNTLKIIDLLEVHNVINLKNNLGFGKANNIGIKYAYEQGADYFLLLNQDAYLYPDTLEKLIDSNQIEPEYEIVCPIQLDNTEKKMDLIFSVDIFPGICADIISDGFLNQLKNKIYPAKFVNAACWLMTKSCIEKIGGFSPIFYHYGEDNNYCHRMEYHGIKMGIYPFALIIHHKKYPDRDYFQSYPEILERQQLVNFANPKHPELISIERKKQLRYILGSIIKLNFLGFVQNLKEFKRLSKLERQIVPHIIKSQKLGSNFLYDE
jgi:GT2 family glycosyltransferase